MGQAPNLNRRALIGGLGLSLAAPAVLRAADAASPDYVEIATSEGRLRGVRDNGLSIFKGVRYAAPPIGQFRFKAPGKLESWTGVRDALAYGAPAIQPNAQGLMPAEDCLFLNLWTPAAGADGRKRAVMFYLHGGAFVSGSANSRNQDGANLARNNDVVVVETNHRLGLMGFLWLGDLLGAEYATSGNQSLFDITEGLDWVRRNIEAFGGDPNNVMVWGESGGAAKTSAMLAFNPAAKLFHKASIESGPGIRMTSREQAAASARYAIDRLGIAPGDARKILDVPAAQLLAVQGGGAPGQDPAADATARARAVLAGLLGAAGRSASETGLMGMGAGGFNAYGPVVDGSNLAAHPFDPTAPAIAADKPLIVGGCKDEATAFLRNSADSLVIDKLDVAGLRDRLVTQYGAANGAALFAAYRQDMPGVSPPLLAVAVQSDAFSRCGSTWIAEKKLAQNRAPVFTYRLVEGTVVPMARTSIPGGAGHGSDVTLKFDNRGPSATEPDGGVALMATAKAMSHYWAGFAKTGRPVAEGQPAWTAYTLATRSIMLLKAQCEVVNDQYPNIRKVWSRLMASQA